MEISDRLTAYQFDKCVTTFITIIENALAERKNVKTGKHTQSRPVYEGGIEQLLEENFKLPRPPSKMEKRKRGAMNLLSLAGDPRSGVKLWSEKKPEENGASNGV